jgi:4-amino-4-deoxy-L-arabinose transferase-like glycosyltransferase
MASVASRLQQPPSLQFSSAEPSRKLGHGLLVTIVAVLLVSAVLRFAWLDRYPVGWHHDEAIMGVLAGTVYRGEQHPIFFLEYLGQEPLYVYASAGAMKLFGDDLDVLPLRATSAAFGLATVALTFALARSMFDARVGVVAAAMVGSNFWQVMSSRNGYRSITQPFVEALAIYGLWRAYRGGRLGWYALAGAAMGATLYTYLGARAFPIVFVSFGVWLWLTRGRPSRVAIRRGVILAVTAAAVIAPLAYFFIRHPGAVSARMGQVFIFQPGVSHGHPWQLLADNLAKMLEGFTILGEPLWRYAIPGRPMLVGALAAAFYLGAVLLAAGVWRQSDAHALLAIWIGGMFFPSVLSWDIGEYTLRAMGLVPAIFIVPALGLVWLGDRLAKLGPVGRRLAPAAIALALLTDAAWTARDYFVVWAPSFGASWEGMADAVAQAKFLRTNARPAEEDVFVGNQYYHHPTISQLARPVYSALRWFDGRQDVVFSPEDGRSALYVVGFSGMPPKLDALFPPSARVGGGFFPQGIDGGAAPPSYLAYRLTADEVRARVQQLTTDPALRPVQGRIANALAPVGATVEGPVQSGGDVQTTLLWRVANKLPAGDYQLVVQLIDDKWNVIASAEGLGLPPEEWRPGDVVWSHFSLPVDKDTPSGLYRVQLAFYDSHSRARLPVSDGLPGIQALILGDVRITSNQPVPPPTTRLSARLGADVQLIGVDSPKLLGPNTMSVTLDWSADHPLSQDYTVFVQVLNGDGKLVAQSDSWPANGALPTSSWLPGEVIRDEHRLTLGPNLPTGTYHVIAGLYLLSTGQRLSVQGGGDYVDLGPVSLPAK